MNRNRTVAGLDVHKDSVYLCIMGHDGKIIFQGTYGVLTPELRQMREDMLCRGVTECAMESTSVYWVPVWNELSLFHQAASGPQERCQGRAVDSGMRPEEPHQGEFRTRAHSPGHAQAEPPHHGPQRGDDLQLQQA